MGLLSFIDGKLGKFDEWYFRYHRLSTRREPKLFHLGWGNDAAIDAVNSVWAQNTSAREIDISWDSQWKSTQYGVRERSGRFETPVHRLYLPPESQIATMTFVRPIAEGDSPVVVLMPTSREAGVTKRTGLAKQLALSGISSVLLDSPFMGVRRPDDQCSKTLRYFSDFLLLSAASIEEGRSVLRWLGESGFRQLCCAGISQGGYLATVAGLRSQFETHVVAMLPPDSGGAVLLEGLIGDLCDWSALEKTGSDTRPVRQRMSDLFLQTSLANLSPGGKGKVHVIAAAQDRYIRAAAYRRLEHAWETGAHMQWLSGGHVSSILERRHIVDAITRTFRPMTPTLN